MVYGYWDGVDVPYDLSNSEELTRSHNTELNSPCGEIPPDRLAKCWQLNYHEAAIFLEEGQNNDKLDFHPCSHAALPAYLVVHNRLFYCLDLLSAVVLMSLALMEEPALPGLDVPIAFHVAVELLALCVVAAELVMKLRWLGLRPFFAHKRTVFKLTILLLMFVEALVVAARQTNHFRVLRALRPIFLIDNHYLGGVRRLTRQILQSLPPVFDMLVILFFFMTMFAILAYHMFAAAPEQYFSTLYDSFMNLFVLLTTSNFPDVMIPYYARSKWASLFFVVFLLVHLYFLMNLVLAVVYERFSSLEKDKFRKLLLHRRKACQQAFRLLVNRTSPSCLYFCHFEGLMRYYKPRAKRREVYLMFKTMDVSRNGFLSQEDFLQVLFQLKKSYHDVLGTVFILMPRFLSVGLVLIVVYYFFAIIGIEVFSGYQMEDCCNRHLASLHPPEDNLVRVETRMSKAEIALCSDPTPHPPAPEPLNYATDAAADTLVFRGVRWRTKFSFCLKMYAEEVKEWLDHAELEERRSNEWLILNVQNREGDSTALEAGHESRRTFTL
ncbi:conserved hypothetical protein [Ixodes scapularis]|uniref:EF-hand domain-containing protein n=1 Tax=Ixodes scapularis TaxID=6945 RepID=B7P170_IXOSC|nr:conserved hypothetical protein [Ixodes scapularis]|eukprot:XP_002400556.1 conserved hypothetical protein [Ixodes scapularis]